MPTPVVTPHDVRLYSKDQLSSSPGPSRLSNHASSTSRHHPTTAHNYSETRPPSPRQHCAPLVGAARKFPGSPTISRRGTPSRSQTSTVTTASSSGRATMASWDAGRRDGDETPILGATGPNGVGTTVRARRVPEGAGASELPDDSGRIRVAVRVRPFSEKEKLAGTRGVISMTGNQTRILDPAYFDTEDGSETPDDRSMWERTFSFDHSFWSHSSSGVGSTPGCNDSFSSQADVHRALGEFLLDNACKGFNCSLFAYGLSHVSNLILHLAIQNNLTREYCTFMVGQTGSGKTYTMLGNSSDLTTAAGPGEAGLIPRICVELFQRLGLSSAGGGGSTDSYRSGQASIQVLFCEIYNEQVRDLFSSGGGDGHALRVREHPTTGAFVEGLSARSVTCYQQVQRLLDVGMSARATAATAMNELSSRSHAIFTIVIKATATTKLSRGNKDKGAGGDDGGEQETDVSVRTSKICLVDLAGSERANATGAKGDRLREASNINKSLSTLGDVIKALAKREETGRGSTGHCGGSESFIPYRNSLLTWLLKENIGGNSKTVMLAAISPVADAYQETMSTLRYVERAKYIVNSITLTDANTNPLIGKLREEIRALQELLEQKDGIIVRHEEKEAVLTAALQREHADGYDKLQRTLATVDSLQVELNAEKRKSAEAAATGATASVQSAARAEQRYQDELERLAEHHRTTIAALKKSHDEDIERALAAEAARRVIEMKGALEEAAAQACVIAKTCDDAAQDERYRVEQEHLDALTRLRDDHTKALQRMSQEVVEATATATAQAATVKQKHATEIAEMNAAARSQTAGELNRLRKELEGLHASAVADARASGDSERALAVEQAVAEANVLAAAARAVALADATEAADLANAKNLGDLQREHDNELHCLRYDLKVSAETAKSAAVEEERKRLQIESEVAMAASVATAVSARESSLRQEHHDQTQRAEKEHSKQLAVAEATWRVKYEKDLDVRKEEHAAALLSAAAAAEERLAADLSLARRRGEADFARAKAESMRTIEALKEEHCEHLRKIDAEHREELARVVTAENRRREADIAEAAQHVSMHVDAMRAQAATVLDALKMRHQEEIAEIRKHLAETEDKTHRAVAELEEQECTRSAAVAAPRAAALSAARGETAATVAGLTLEHQAALTQAEKRRQDDLERMRSTAENRRIADLTAVEAKNAQMLADARTEAETEHASRQEQYQEELHFLKRGNETNMEALRAAEEERRGAQLAELADKHALAMAAYKAERDATAAASERRHRDELDNVRRDFQSQTSSLTAAAAVSREAQDAEAAITISSLQSAIAALKAKSDATIVIQSERHKAEVRAFYEEHKADIEQATEEIEHRKMLQLATVREEAASSVANVESRAAESLANLENENKAEIVKLRRQHLDDTTRLAEATEARRAADAAMAAKNLAKVKADCEAEAATAVLALETRHTHELRHAVEQRDVEVRQAAAAATAAGKEEKAAAIENLRDQHQAEMRKWEEDMQALKEQLQIDRGNLTEELRLLQEENATFAAAELKSKSSVEEIKAKMATEMGAKEAKHHKDIQEMMEETNKWVSVAEKEATTVLEHLKAVHLQALTLAREERDTAVMNAIALVEAQKKAALAARSGQEADKLKVATAEAEERLAKMAAKLVEAHQRELEAIGKERESELSAKSQALAEKQSNDLAMVSAQFAERLAKAEKEAEERAESRASERISVVVSDLQARLHAALEHSTMQSSALAISEAAAAEAVEAAAAAADAIASDNDAERQRQQGALEEEHRAKFKAAEEKWAQEAEALRRRVEQAETTAAEAEASVEESSTRAAALEGMLRSSVGSREQELAGHRSRVVQLQAFVSRRDLASHPDSNASDGKSEAAPISSRSVQQRMIHLKSMVAGTGVAIGSTVTGEAPSAAFVGVALSKGQALTMEQYAEELEAVVIRATVETATARQDHLEADMQVKNVTRQLVGLKLVHAQLRERLEDTQIKLEHKSQSAARRWLASAARLAQEFARPDRYAVGSSSPRSSARDPAEISKNNATGQNNAVGFGPRSPIFGRRSASKSPPHQRVSSSGAVDFSRTL